jgi:hypothetical protein
VFYGPQEGQVKRARRIKPDEKVAVVFTARERQLIIEHTFAGPEVVEPLEQGRPRGGRYTLRLTLDDLDDLLGYVAAEANHSRSKALQKELDTLYERLQAEMESYDDGQWPKPPEPSVAGRGDVGGRAKLALVKGKNRP